MDIEKRLKEIEIELEKVEAEIEEREKTDPLKGWEIYCAHMQPLWNKESKLDREQRMLKTPEFKKISNYGDVMSLESFIECVKDGGFIDYDGFGRYVKDDKESDINIYPSDIGYGAVRKDFDTIIWFNR